MAGNDIRIKDKPVSSDIGGSDYLLGTRDNGNGTFSDYRYQNNKKITIASGAPSATLTDPFFSNSIKKIFTNNQVYIIDADFTQTGTTITLLNGMTFNNTQVLIAEL